MAEEAGDLIYLHERRKMTGGGVTAVVLMVLFNVVMTTAVLLFGDLRAEPSLLLALLWLVGNQVFSLGVLVGWERNYVVSRSKAEYR
jgi:hypothetical protein